MKPACTVLLCISLLLSCSLFAHAQFDSAGIIKTVSGEAFITNSKSTIKAVANMKFMVGDSIRTGANSSTGLIFEDDTVVALGPNSEMTIDSFLFSPATKELSFLTRLIHGTFSFITGQIAKLAPDKVSLETPDATLGVRGTKFLVKVD